MKQGQEGKKQVFPLANDIILEEKYVHVLNAFYAATQLSF